MKYFFLSDGWSFGRVWASDGLWNETAWRRRPNIERMSICLVDNNEKLWLYRVEDAILTVEVKPLATAEVGPAAKAIGQVVLKRLITAEQVLERMAAGQAMCQLNNIEAIVF